MPNQLSRKSVLLAGLWTFALPAAAGTLQPNFSPAPTPVAVDAMTHFVQSGPNTMAYTRSGNGPAVVIIHGIGGHKEDWEGVAASLAGRHTVYAVDMIGFGASSKTGERITIADQAAAILALLHAEHVGRADLIGNSVGGWVAATFAASHPDRTRRLVLVDAAGFKAMFEGKPPVEFYPRDEAAAANLLRHVRHDPAALTPEKAREAMAASQASGDVQAAAAVGQGMFASPRLEDVADRITVPTLIVWGENDGLFPTAIADLVARHVKGARTVLIPNASHFPQLDNPGAFDRAVAPFLRG